MASPIAPGVVRVPGWDLYPWLRAGFSTRQGGGSGAYGPAEQNLGWTPEDSAEVVAANRDGFVQAVFGQPTLLVTIRQIHGAVLQAVETGHKTLQTRDGKAILEGDGLMTSLPGMLLGVQTADCVPILLACTRTRAVAAIHAGWRGTVARIVEVGTSAMLERYGSDPADLVAAIGPCIGPCCFDVGDEVRTAFRSEFVYGAELSTGSGTVDLVEANRRQLLASGLLPGQITLATECTACTRMADGSRKFFSHRSEKGRTGRMLSVIGISG